MTRSEGEEPVFTGSTATRTAPMVLDIGPDPSGLGTVFGDLWRVRELVGTLARRDFFSRYRRATLGVLWAAVMPLIQAGVLAFVFTRVARLQIPGNPFVFVYTGIAAWSFFSSSVGVAGVAVVENATLASRIYFPRLALPVVGVLSGSYLMVINYAIALVAAYVTGSHQGFWVLLVPVSMVLGLLLTVFFAAALSAIHVYFRDVKYLVQAVLMAAFYLTPAIYPLTRAPSSLRYLVELNPMTGVIEMARRGLIGADPMWVHTVEISIGWLVPLTVLTAWLYSRFDRVFSDLM